MIDDIWGPWIDHDGKGCPVPARTIVHRVFDEPARGADVEARGKMESISAVDPEWESGSWRWKPMCVRIIRYRIRKPRGMTVLQKIVANPERELEEAE